MLEIYDCTLREGEQAGGVSFGVKDRVEIAKMLYDFGVHFIELGWPVNKEAMDAFLELQNIFKNCCFWLYIYFGKCQRRRQSIVHSQ
jgi:isopropylmalate/homocitrate/citramalate synthase